MEHLIAKLVGGAIGGFAGSRAWPLASMGLFGNLLTGAVGGLSGGRLLSNLVGTGTATSGSLDVATLATHLIGGCIGGVVLQIIIGLMMKKMLR